ncbi:MAG: haloacid dehalogenase-like hydrolase [Armatimonadetes bacterium]|nr:haloacid dehalogenase-like hydrolase [Armatimonadota bacterium]
MSNPAGSPFEGVRAVLFDLDGTLVHSSIDFAAMLDELKVWATVRGLAAPEGSFDLLGYVAAATDHLGLTAGVHTARECRRGALTLLERMEEEYCGHAEAMPGAVDLIMGLRRRRVACAIVTRNCRPVAQRLVGAVGLAALPLVTRDDTPYWNPDPRHLWAGLAAAGAYGVPFVSIGDHWMDARAGRAAGATTIGLLHGRTPAANAECPPDWFAEDLSTVAAWTA